MAYTDTRTSIKTAGFDTIHLKWVGDDAYYQVPLIRDGEITFETQQTMDTRQRQYPHSILCRVTFKTFAVDVTNLIKKLDDISLAPILFKILALNSVTYSSGNISATTGYFGLTWRYVCEGDFNAEQYVEFTFQRRLTFAQYQLMLNSAPADGTPNVADNLYALYTNLTVADIKPASVTKIEWRNSTDAPSWTHAATTIRNGSITGELSPTAEDTLGRPVGTAVAVNVSVELLQTTSTELSELDTYAAQENDYKLTLGDGTVVDLTNTLGITWTYRNGGNADGISTIVLTGRGVTTLSSFVGMFT